MDLFMRFGIYINTLILVSLGLFLGSCAHDPEKGEQSNNNATSSIHDANILNINYVRSDFQPGSSLNDNYFYNISPKKVVIKDISQTQLNPRLEKNGFQVEDFSASAGVLGLLDAVAEAARQGMGEKARKHYVQPTLGAFEDHMAAWAKKNLSSMSFDEVVCGRGWYRNTKISLQRRGKADMQLEIAHIDFFPGQDLSNLFSITGFNEQLSRKIGPEALDKAYWKKNQMVKMVNVWMPLSTVHAYPLAVCDTSTLDFSRDIIPNFSEVNGIAKAFQSGALRYDRGHQFYYKSAMKRGEAFIFESFGTPHTAIRLPNQQGHRESFDIRCAFIKKGN